MVRSFILLVSASVVLCFLQGSATYGDDNKKTEFEYAPKPMALHVFDKSALITDFDAKYESDFVKDLLGSKGMRLKLNVKNTSRQDIVAIQVGFVFFNYFNEPMGYTSTLVLDVLGVGETKAVESKAKFVGDAEAYPVFVFIHKIKYADRSVEIIDIETVRKAINARLGIDCGVDMFASPEEQRRKRFGVSSLVGFIL
ncbi:hypothetical protein J7K50_09785 [bacterium]|nr:hypothetical protein [bacterium]